MPRFIDLELFIRLADRFDFLHHAEPLVRWNYSEGISTDRQAFAASRLYLLPKYRLRLERNKRHLANQYLQTALAFESIDDTKESCRLALKAILADPLILKEAYTGFRGRGAKKVLRNVFRLLRSP